MRELDILKPFFENPDRDYHLRELARLLKISPATAGKYAEQFVKEGILEKRQMRIYTLYSANQKSPLFKEYLQFYNKINALKRMKRQ